MVLRRFTRMLLLIVMVVVSVALFIGLGGLSRSLDEVKTRRVRLDLLQLEMPAGFALCEERFHEGWNIQEYCAGGNGSFQLAWAEGNSGNVPALARRYFNIPQELAVGAPSRYRANGSWWMVRALPIGESGVYAVRTKGKGRVATVFFGAGTRLYWMSFSIHSSLAEEFSLFHRTVRSVEWNGHAISGSEAALIMKRTCKDGYYLFCQPLWMFSVLPFVIGILLFGILGAVGRRMGRLPDALDADGQIPFFQEADVDVSMSTRGRSSVVRMGLLVYSDAMVLTMFGRPRIRVPHDRKDGIEIRRVNGFLGQPALEIEGDAQGLVTKKTRFTSGRWKIRVYCTDPERVLAYLG